MKIDGQDLAALPKRARPTVEHVRPGVVFESRELNEGSDNSAPWIRDDEAGAVSLSTGYAVSYCESATADHVYPNANLILGEPQEVAPPDDTE